MVCAWTKSVREWGVGRADVVMCWCKITEPKETDTEEEKESSHIMEQRNKENTNQ